MFGHRTPEPKHQLTSKDIEKKTERAGPSSNKEDQPNKVRHSIGEIEARAMTSPPQPRKPSSQTEGKSKAKTTSTSSSSKTTSQNVKAALETPGADKSPKQITKYKNRTSEAKAWLLKAKLHLGNSHNLKGEIKQGVLDAIEMLYNLVKESEEEKTVQNKGKEDNENRTEDRPMQGEEVMRKLEEHSKLLKDNSEEMERLAGMLRKQQEWSENRSTYANVVAGSLNKQPSETTAMHSIIIASKDDMETGDQVFERIRKVVNAKDEGVRIDRIRKAKDRKIIVGCRSREEIRKVKDRIVEKEIQLSVEEIKNKDPLVILYGVLQSNTDEDIMKAVRTQNKHLLKDVSGEEDRMEIRFRRRARNPLTSHIVVRVSPRIWQSLTGAGAVHIDMQRIRVADQSPLIQCSRCLGYGHGKRFCPDAIDVCSHCGGAHLKTECPDYISEVPPCCTNCVKAKASRVDHNAFSSECPVRRKWEAHARSTVAYC